MSDMTFDGVEVIEWSFANSLLVCKNPRRNDAIVPKSETVDGFIEAEHRAFEEWNESQDNMYMYASRAMAVAMRASMEMSAMVKQDYIPEVWSVRELLATYGVNSGPRINQLDVDDIHQSEVSPLRQAEQEEGLFRRLTGVDLDALAGGSGGIAVDGVDQDGAAVSEALAVTPELQRVWDCEAEIERLKADLDVARQCGVEWHDMCKKMLDSKIKAVEHNRALVGDVLALHRKVLRGEGYDPYHDADLMERMEKLEAGHE